MARWHDEEVLRIPFAVDPTLEEAQVAFDFLEFPAALLADLLDLFVEMEGFGEAEPDKDAMGVVLRPTIHDFEQVLRVLLAVFFDPLTVSGTGVGGVRRAGGEEGRMRGWRGVTAASEAFEPARGIEVSGGQVPGERLIALASTEEEGDAIVGAGDDQRGMSRAEALDDVAAECIADQQGVILARRLGIHKFLQSSAAGGRPVV